MKEVQHNDILLAVPLNWKQQKHDFILFKSIHPENLFVGDSSWEKTKSFLKHLETNSECV